MNHEIFKPSFYVTSSRTTCWNLLALMILLFMLGGCTTVHVNSKPSGADVMASYNRGAFGWTQWGRECQTPCTFTTGSTVQLRIRWADNALSEIRQGDYHPFGATYDFNFDKSASAPAASVKNDANTSTGKVEQAQQLTPQGTESKKIVGRIESYFIGGLRFKSGPPLWPCGMIRLVSDDGGKSDYLIVGSGANATVFYDVNGKEMGILGSFGGAPKPVEGKKIEIKYVEAPATYVTRALAVSVRYLE